MTLNGSDEVFDKFSALLSKVWNRVGGFAQAAATTSVPVTMDMSPAIDRWVRAQSSPGEDPKPPQRLSEFRDVLFLVLLGEPGIGKSTALEGEARRGGVPVLTVGRFMADPDVPPASSLYLDALDEYRIDGGALDKVNGLAAKLASVQPLGLRITCRAEDWRAGADLRALNGIAGDSGIVVVQVLPLDDAQIVQILTSFGEQDPVAFVAEARVRGAGALLENPLSLRLLRTAVRSDGEWPGSRFDVFERATTLLSYEHNDTRKERRDRTSAETILAAADKAALVLLCTSARAIWRSAGAPPVDLGRHQVLMASDIGLTVAETSDTLDTPLFHGTQSWFEPMHRSVAEFMAGRALARAAIGEFGPALPLSRALALIVAPDGKAPGELRGLFAWFAAHLARRGAADKAAVLVERDAVSVLVYGDAAAFDLPTRLLLLDNLNRDDPYFLHSEDASTAIGALAQPDMADAFTAVLNAPTTDHRLDLVFQVLITGTPMASLRPLLLGIALDPSREEWQRVRAVSAWLNADGEGDAMRRELFDALAPEASSTTKEALRARLLAESADRSVSDADVRDVLSAYAGTPDDRTVLRLYPLERRLRDHPRLGMLDASWSGWLPSYTPLSHGSEVHRAMDGMLASAILGEPDPDPGRIWLWTVNAREERLDELGDDSAKALGEWLGTEATRPTELFLAIFDDPVTAADTSGSAAHAFFFLTMTWPGAEIARALIRRGDQTADPAERSRIAAELAEIARNKLSAVEAFEAAWNWLSRAEQAQSLARLSLSLPDVQRERQAARTRELTARRARHRADIVMSYSRRLGDMRSGAALEELAELIKPYFFPEGSAALDPFQRIVAQSDVATAEAAIAGFESVAMQAPPFTAYQLGEATAKSETFAWEAVAVAGVDVMLRGSSTLDKASLELALIVLRQSGYLQDDDRRQTVEQWAWGRLDADPNVGAARIRESWDGALATRRRFDDVLQPVPDNRHWSRAYNLALEKMLADRPNLAANTLHHLLMQAAERLAPARLRALAVAALATTPLSTQAKARWSLVLFALDGDAQRALLQGHRGSTMNDLLEGSYGDGLLGIIPAPDDANRAARSAAVVRMLGAGSKPGHSRPTGRLLQPYRASDAVQSALRMLESNTDPAAGVMLRELLVDVKLQQWLDAIRHARARQLRNLRDTSFVAPTPKAVLDAMAGKGPVNGADLRAIVVDELRELGRSMRSGAEGAWKFYWNTDKGTPTTAKIENDARDITLKLIAERLKPYGVPVALPEVTRGLSTRADVVLANGAGRNLPIEAKRHYHDDLWTAASDQLQGYATAEGADGNGVLLVFWFGADWTPTPTRADGHKPESAQELEAMLLDDLSPALRDRTDVVVLDVSRHKGGKSRAAMTRAAKPSPKPSGGSSAKSATVPKPKAAATPKAAPTTKAAPKPKANPAPKRSKKPATPK